MMENKKYLEQLPFAQLFKFGFVGILATGVNYFIVILLVELCHLPPLVANLFAFLIGFGVSFLGHRYWTFQTAHTNLQLKLHRFFIISVLSLSLNETLFFLLLKYTALPYFIALFLVLLIVPPLTFISSKRWGCQQKSLMIGIK